ncbi:MAG TPA: hypothetical protein VNZ52_13035 [Candidatus Thermoplasmatota archaeon]|nr:hypothetical protein [Candidatus Thermoplasmatota archaeon]
MMINEAKPIGENDLRELRVKIPGDLYRKLHATRVIKGEAIRDIVERALLEYFRARAEAQRGHGVPTATAPTHPEPNFVLSHD